MGKVSWITSVNCSYYLIRPNGNIQIIYNGKPERIIIGEITEEELEAKKTSNEVMNFEYYRIDLQS
jgi:predicted transcriptional regulator